MPQGPKTHEVMANYHCYAWYSCDDWGCCPPRRLVTERRPDQPVALPRGRLGSSSLLERRYASSRGKPERSLQARRG